MQPGSRTNSTMVIKRLGTHPPGSWDFTDIQSNISFQTGALKYYKYYSFSNGTNDNLMTQVTNYDGGVNGQAYGDNKGHYGVKNKVKITFKTHQQQNVGKLMCLLLH